MKIGLFAAGPVGYKVAEFFGDSQEPLSFLVVDAKDPYQLNDRIAYSSKIQPSEVYLSDQLQDTAVLAHLESLHMDFVILAWWPYILKESIIKLAKRGCLNFHPSFLPHNRGKHYNFWNLVEAVPFGVTIHFVDSGIDTGDIAFQSSIPTTWEDTGKSLYDKAQAEVIRLFVESFPLIKSGEVPRIPQNLETGSFHKASELEKASQIYLDRTYTARELLNLLRARTFPPHPGAWFIDQGDKYQIRIEITKVSVEYLPKDESGS